VEVLLSGRAPGYDYFRLFRGGRDILVSGFHWFLVSMYQYFKVTGKVSELRKRNKQLLDEIKALRNLPLEEVAPQDMVEDEGENR